MPPRNASFIGAGVCSHSGEFFYQSFDIALPGRGLSFRLNRLYRSSLSTSSGVFGRGWTFSYALSLESGPAGSVIYRDALRNPYVFTRKRPRGSFRSPRGFYGVLDEVDATLALRLRHGELIVFQRLDDGGRVRKIVDRNGNTIQFSYSAQSIVVREPLGRQISYKLHGGRIAAVTDHRGRVWTYGYDEVGCLKEVVGPATTASPGSGPRVAYEYDEYSRVISMVDPKGQEFLRNRYDQRARIHNQRHGAEDYTFEYEPIRPSPPDIYRTRCTRSNGSLLIITHSPEGHAIERSRVVSGDSLARVPSGQPDSVTVSITVHSRYNHHGELITRTYPDGNATTWRYDDRAADARARGNLIRVIHTPSPSRPHPQGRIVTSFSYERTFQFRKSIRDARGHTKTFAYDKSGNLTARRLPVTVSSIDTAPRAASRIARVVVERYEYNQAGQIIRAIDGRGAQTVFYYYSTQDPTGARGEAPSRQISRRPGGYLAQVVRDPASRQRALRYPPANVITRFSYDASGNVTAIWDGKNNPTRFGYDLQDRVIEVVSRAPFHYRTTITYDANGNPESAAMSFERQRLANGRVTAVPSQLGWRCEYDALNRLTRRIVTSGQEDIVEIFERDRAGNIVRAVEPLGNVVEYQYDERNLLSRADVRLADGTRFGLRRRYTMNGQVSESVDETGAACSYEFDGFDRCHACVAADGTSWRRTIDQVGNITAVDISTRRIEGQPARSSKLLRTTRLYWDELNRLVRVADARTAAAFQYADNHRPARVVTSRGGLIDLEYGGHNRLVGVKDGRGRSVRFDYDENSNPVGIDISESPNGSSPGWRSTLIQGFDPLDRPVRLALNGREVRGVTYNSLGRVSEYRDGRGAVLRSLDDAFGRRVGLVCEQEGGSKELSALVAKLLDSPRMSRGPFGPYQLPLFWGDDGIQVYSLEKELEVLVWKLLPADGHRFVLNTPVVVTVHVDPAANVDIGLAGTAGVFSGILMTVGVIFGGLAAISVAPLTGFLLGASVVAGVLSGVLGFVWAGFGSVGPPGVPGVGGPQAGGGLPGGFGGSRTGFGGGGGEGAGGGGAGGGGGVGGGGLAGDVPGGRPGQWSPSVGIGGSGGGSSGSGTPGQGGGGTNPPSGSGTPGQGGGGTNPPSGSGTPGQDGGGKGCGTGPNGESVTRINFDDGTVTVCTTDTKAGLMPNPDSDVGLAPSALPPGIIGPLGPGIAAYDPTGDGTGGTQGGPVLPTGIHPPLGPLAVPNPETGGPVGPASAQNFVRTPLFIPNPDGGGPFGPAAMVGIEP